MSKCHGNKTIGYPETNQDICSSSSPSDSLRSRNTEVWFLKARTVLYQIIVETKKESVLGKAYCPLMRKASKSN